MKSYSQGGQDIFVNSFFNEDYRGYFLDIGCERPIIINNTYFFELKGWKGVSIDIKDMSNEWNVRTTPFIKTNALTCNYDELLKKYNMPKVIDFLSLDIEGNGDRFQALKKVIKTSFDFKVLTIEHDAYRGYDESERQPQRKFLNEMGFILVCSDVSLQPNAPYEDWWINPKYIDKDQYVHLISNNNLYNMIINKIKK